MEESASLPLETMTPSTHAFRMACGDFRLPLREPNAIQSIPQELVPFGKLRPGARTGPSFLGPDVARSPSA